ncbi:MAG: hypothetical protein ACYTG5_21780 [Planctomycetota bacterium]|jgi:hypothetical protein
MKANYRRFKRPDKGYSRVSNKAEFDRALTEEGPGPDELALLERSRPVNGSSSREVWDSNRLSGAMGSSSGNRLRGLEVIEQAVAAAEREETRRSQQNWFTRFLGRLFGKA